MLLHFLLLILSFSLSSLAYQVSVSDTDYSRQICSGMCWSIWTSTSIITSVSLVGMWANEKTYINVTFDAASQGQLAMVVYEWSDVQYLGKITSFTDDELPVGFSHPYIAKRDVDRQRRRGFRCTRMPLIFLIGSRRHMSAQSNAMAGGFCTQAEMGKFIIDLPTGKYLNATSFWTARVELPANRTSSPSGASNLATGGSFWDNPEGNPTPPPGNNSSPWRRGSTSRAATVDLNPSPDGLYSYSEPIKYLVRKTGYYCVAMVPVTVQRDESHATYNGLVFFQNTFDGKLPATDYPKVNFYFAMFLVYAAFGAAWGWMCYQHVHELLPIQYYLSGLVGLVIIEMVANWAYYRYLNAHGKSTASTVFLIVVAILDAGRNSMSFFMLLVVSLGLSVVRESLGRTMLRCQILAGGHFIFGILYAVGIVELELESTSALVLLIFVIPLAFTLSGFLLWILYSLNATIAQLRARKQRYKLSMFENLYRILLFTVLVIAVFFVVSTLSFSGRLAEDYSAKSWRVRWWLLDGWLALLYLVAFSAISYLWRPSANNRRLAMSDEIAQDEEDAEDYDLESMGQHGRIADDDDDDAATLVGVRRGGHEVVADDNVVFEIGDEDDEDDEEVKKRRRRLSGEQPRSGEEERRGLMNDGDRRDD
ncbi:lung seven transmembrane receptor-domain-containing protein [Mycena alexandri]|uniref:Lung seven transmembrane receptor-domain-containing protein n=1 Tax=Mycena alexandri TaxID=1745969 RepID=A0AAD6X9K5_9AGAR|nr:lung seven transmembrane receptor-domain-containing protein [Mycena alexandri]